ncbi:IclR family transcriptional regulator [Aureibacillus halotolerans]|uniref:IclR family transcriptional regulator n=1 Tax=Aureibacillus halotolerans TaxID=1508390 RepID=A0A4R6U458_9BACI|nr:IclR family transcriptional regulator [Aureibacillus halotolerans]TDQ40881.1 IclR family transcriptional regulator [Aureibacillus halotolerans]
MKSFDRAMHIVTMIAFDEQKSDWSISEISDQLHLPLSTTHRLLMSLQKHKLIEQQEETKKYSLGKRWVEIGLRMLDSMELKHAARPYMKKLAEESEESVFLSVRNHNHGILIDRIDGPLNVKVIERLGERRGLHYGAPNKAIFAFTEHGDRERILRDCFEAEEDRERMRDQLDVIVARGYSISFGEITKGTASVAAPILSYDSSVLGALGVELVGEVIEERRLDDLIKRVQEKAQAISALFGGPSMLSEKRKQFPQYGKS